MQAFYFFCKILEERYIMRKKDKKIEIQIAEKNVKLNQQTFEGYSLTAGKKEIGAIAEIDGQFAVLKNDSVDVLYKTFDQAVEKIIENFNLNY